jgi:cytochrome c553
MQFFSVVMKRCAKPASATRAVAGKSIAAVAFALGVSFAGMSSASATPAIDAHNPLLTTCAACHGATGEGSSAGGIPRLAGQNADYLAHALSMFKAGARKSAVMQPITMNLSATEMRQLADYFAMQSPPLAQAVAAPQAAQVAAGAQLAQAGDGGNNLAACFSCHAAGGKGNDQRFPSIAGQPATFTVQRLHEFQARAQHGAAKPGSMTSVAAQMSDSQIEAVAAYLSTLPR